MLTCLLVQTSFLSCIVICNSSWSKEDATVGQLEHGYVVGQNEIQVKLILTQFDSQFPLSSNPNYS